MHFRIWRRERGASNSDSVSYSVIQELSGIYYMYIINTHLNIGK
jgi:hypothetical protein